MQDSLIARLLDTHLDTEEELSLILEEHLKSLTGVDSESPLFLA